MKPEFFIKKNYIIFEVVSLQKIILTSHASELKIRKAKFMLSMVIRFSRNFKMPHQAQLPRIDYFTGKLKIYKTTL